MLGSLVAKMVPSFQQMQERIDRVNRVLREQITGIRVVRAFVREPQERVRFAEANADLTETSLRTGRLMAGMFPTVMFIINASSIAVLWIGANRIEAGQLELGSLVAYLTYLIQILMAVVMATFMISMIPRAAVAADRIVEVLETPSSVAIPTDPVTTVTEHGTLEFDDVRLPLPGGRAARARGHLVPGRGRANDSPSSASTGSGKTTLVDLIPRLFDATEGVVSVDGVDVRRLRSGPVLAHGRLRAHRSPTCSRARSPAICATADPRRPMPRCGRPWRSPRRPTSSSDARRPRQPDHPGRHQRLRWAAPAARHRQSPGRQARVLRVRRFILGP